MLTYMHVRVYMLCVIDVVSMRPFCTYLRKKILDVYAVCWTV